MLLEQAGFEIKTYGDQSFAVQGSEDRICYSTRLTWAIRYFARSPVTRASD